MPIPTYLRLTDANRRSSRQMELPALMNIDDQSG